MATINYSEPKRSMEIVSDDEIPVGEPQLRELVAGIDSFNDKIELDTFNVVRDNTDHKKFTYAFVAKDGREWHQNLVIQSGIEAKMNFNVTDLWKESEFAFHRVIRASIIGLVIKYHIVTLSCEWS